MVNTIFALIILTASAATTLSESCGKRTVKYSQPPWIVSLQEKGRHFCGGSLVRVGEKDETDIVVTSAACVNKITTITDATVVATNIDTSVSEQTAKIRETIYYPQFDEHTHEHDIAIVLLDKATPIKFSNAAVQPICLPLPEDRIKDQDGDYEGWRLNKDGGIGLFDVLQKIVSTDACASQYKSSKENSGVVVFPESEICAEYYNWKSDATGITPGDWCPGGSGSPFSFTDEGIYYLHGVVNFGDRCAGPDLPAVSARVPYYVKWIKNQINHYSSQSDRA